jgi:hypothetical protein
MITENVIAITAQTYEEEQFLLTKFPNSYWFLKDGQDFHTFMINSKKEQDVIKAVTEWIMREEISK